jgi:nicotinate-nucleotide--dimethylbenzimidazole phosphoribosyltransferase
LTFPLLRAGKDNAARRLRVNPENFMPSPLLTPSLARECASVVLPDPALEREAVTYLNTLTKPPGSLGRLEELARRLFAIQEKAPLAARPARMFTIAADHGVVEEGVASNGKELTALMVRNFLNGGAAVNCLCGTAGAELRIVDAGIDAAPFDGHPLLINAKIARGTANMAKGPAMTRGQCLRALQLGVDLAESAVREGVRVIGTGEMGIGNTTASSALYCAYLGFSAAAVTGQGAGIPRAGLAHKAAIIEKALEVNAAAVAGGDPLAILSALGGLEIAALAGLIIGGAARRLPVMLDGFIACAAYVAAWKLAPAVSGYCFFGHGSAEMGHGKVLKNLGKIPLLDLGLRLGEGTGAALGFLLLAAAADIYNNMASFAQAGIELSESSPEQGAENG